MSTEQKQHALSAVIYNDPETISANAWALGSTRRRWRVALSNGSRRFTSTRREAIEWCDEHGIPYTLSQAPR